MSTQIKRLVLGINNDIELFPHTVTDNAQIRPVAHGAYPFGHIVNVSVADGVRAYLYIVTHHLDKRFHRLIANTSLSHIHQITFALNLVDTKAGHGLRCETH